MGAVRNTFNGFLGLVGLAPKPDTRPYERRVFLVADPGKRAEILDMMAKHDAAIMQVFGALMNAAQHPEQQPEALKQFSAAAHAKPSDSEKLNALAGISNWPGMLAAKDHKGLWVGEHAAEAVLRKGEVYITLPTAEHIESSYDEPGALATIKAWTPPAWLQEVPASTLDRRPVGFPRASPSSETIQKYQHPQP
ncbi:MAG TPA: hypothetical protein VL625_12890 [Patescibacteria group bacterium]|nr:hypothetical protein [Patescibacteria group bacterium]